MAGFGPEDDHFVVELTYNYGIKEYQLGNDFQVILIICSSRKYHPSSGKAGVAHCLPGHYCGLGFIYGPGIVWLEFALVLILAFLRVLWFSSKNQHTKFLFNIVLAGHKLFSV